MGDTESETQGLLVEIGHYTGYPQCNKTCYKPVMETTNTPRFLDLGLIQEGSAITCSLSTVALSLTDRASDSMILSAQRPDSNNTISEQKSAHGLLSSSRVTLLAAGTSYVLSPP
jgi:hypothetical protein